MHLLHNLSAFFKPGMTPSLQIDLLVGETCSFTSTRAVLTFVTADHATQQRNTEKKTRVTTDDLQRK